MDTLLIILVAGTLFISLLILVLLFTQKTPTQNGVQKVDLAMLSQQLDQTITQANRAVTDVVMVLQRQVGQSQSDQQQAQGLFRSELTHQLSELTKTSEGKLEAIRMTTFQMLEKLQKDNDEKLEKMRATVDEKLNKTLEDRLTQKFQLISAQFESVQKGFGEMQSLVSGVDELKKALSNVKTRGIMGEVQLGRILEEILSPDLYIADHATIPGSKNRVEYAVKLPGDGQHPVLLPIDAKFPLEDYYAVLSAYDTNDKNSIDQALKILETKIESFANDISKKYVQVPYTTNFGILFLPMEGLYAEAIRRGLVDTLQRKYQVVIAGPTTMAALLNSLQIGFKTLAIQKKSQEVWNVLANVREQFDTFADVLAKTQEKIQQAGSELDKLVGVRTRKIQNSLRELDTVESNLKLEKKAELPEED